MSKLLKQIKGEWRISSDTIAREYDRRLSNIRQALRCLKSWPGYVPEDFAYVGPPRKQTVWINRRGMDVFFQRAHGGPSAKARILAAFDEVAQPQPHGEVDATAFTSTGDQFRSDPKYDVMATVPADAKLRDSLGVIDRLLARGALDREQARQVVVNLLKGEK